MARRSRDYRAEYAARNARARANGFSSYSQQRRAQERQEFSKRIGPSFPQYAKAGYGNESDYRAARDRAKKWSDAHSHKETSAYRKGMSASELAAYEKAYLTYPMSHDDKIEALREYIVDIMGLMSEDEFEHDDNYGEI